MFIIPLHDFEKHIHESLSVIILLNSQTGNILLLKIYILLMKIKHLLTYITSINTRYVLNIVQSIHSAIFNNLYYRVKICKFIFIYTKENKAVLSS